jgi:hypothetical protein
MTIQLRKIPVWIRLAVAGLVTAASLATGLALAGAAGASPSPASGAVCARPGSPGKGAGVGGALHPVQVKGAAGTARCVPGRPAPGTK